MPRSGVERANFLADIAAEDVVADERAQLCRDGPVIFDSEISDAASRIEREGIDEGVGRASIEAAATLAAARLGRLARLADHVRKQLAENDVTADAGRDEHGVLGDEAD